MNKWQTWWDNLPPHTQEYLKSQPIWHDRDLVKVLLIGFAVGLVIGLAV
jgi:hypothetical protein